MLLRLIEHYDLSNQYGSVDIAAAEIKRLQQLL
jgi:hypothetical protein